MKTRYLLLVLWILWTQTTVYTEFGGQDKWYGGVTGKWIPVADYSTRDKCEVARAEKLKNEGSKDSCKVGWRLDAVCYPMGATPE
jgi:hypothetical protein